MGNQQGGGMGGQNGSGGGGYETAQNYQDPDPSNFISGGTPVYVNVYHLMPGPQTVLNGAIMGLGVFHSGVEVGGAEFAFGGDMSSPNRPGVFQHPPKAILPAPQFHRTHHIGNLPGSVTFQQVQKISQELGDPDRGGWTCGSYNLMLRNCNHFAETFVEELSRRLVESTGAQPLVYPSYVNRAAKFGTGVVPPPLLALFQKAAPKAPGANNHEETNFSGPPRATPGAHAYANAANTNTDGNTAPQKPKPKATPRPKSAAAQAPKAAAPAAAAAAKPAAKSDAELSELSARELRDLAKAHGIDTRALLEKQDYLAAIAAAQKKSS
jgi:hypothetical protein